MRSITITILVFTLFLFSCKKKETEEPAPAKVEFDGSSPGKIKSINSGYWSFKYTEEGLISEYKYNSSGVTKTATVSWTTSQVTCDDGIGYQYVRPRNTAGYALPGTQDNNTGINWSYDAAHHVVYLNGRNYYWSNDNLDSLILSGAVTKFEYSTYLDNRNYGANFIPTLNNFPVYNMPTKNLKNKYVQLNLQRDTVSIRTFTYLFDSSNRVIKETEKENINGTPQLIAEWYYEYY